MEWHEDHLRALLQNHSEDVERPQRDRYRVMTEVSMDTTSCADFSRKSWLGFQNISQGGGGRLLCDLDQYHTM